MFLHLILCISTHFDNKVASSQKCFMLSVHWITRLHTAEHMQYFQGLPLFKVSNTLLGFIEPIKQNSNWALSFGNHARALKVGRALSQSSGPEILGLGLTGEKLPHFLPGWEVSEKSHKSEAGDRCFNPESNLPPQKNILFASLWRYLVSNLLLAENKT